MNLNNEWQDRIADSYARHARSVWRVCYYFMQNPADADDLQQETFIKLIEKNPDFKDERHERGWLIVTAANLCKDALKGSHRYHESLDEHPELEAESEIVKSELFEALAQLPDEYKTIIYLSGFEGYTYREIAKLVNKSVSNVGVLLFRARKMLKDIMEGK